MPLDPRVLIRLQSNYIDYPGFFLNPYGPGTEELLLPEASPLGYFDTTSGTVTGEPGSYAIRCPAGESNIEALIDGRLQTLPCAGEEGLTHVFTARDVARRSTEDPPLELLRLRRLLF